MRLPVEIDGSRGEGGGQILRTSLALAIVTGRKLRMKQIRARRRNPGLRPQHLACVSAAAQLCGAIVRDIGVGSQEMVFMPGTEWPRELTIDVGTAGSTTLVVQTIAVPALGAPHPIRAVITGGTHNDLAPPFEFLDRVFLPRLREMGAQITASLERHGVLPQGGGRIVLEVSPSRLRPIEITEAGAVVARRATAIVAGLPRHIAEREIVMARKRLNEPVCEIRELEGGPHNLFMAEVDLASGARELATAHGRIGYPAEHVAADALDEIVDFLETGVPVGEHLADQLLLPLAVAGGGRFRTLAPLTDHATTNIATIREFLDVPIRIEETEDVATVIVG